MYGLIGLMPGDPIDIMLSGDPRMTPADRERLRTLFGLDLPIYERYGNWLAAAVTGDFGYSRTFNKPVLEVMGPYLGRTALLMGLSFTTIRKPAARLTATIIMNGACHPQRFEK